MPRRVNCRLRHGHPGLREPLDIPPAEPTLDRVSTPQTLRHALIVQYDGTDYHGWQLQPGVRTVQGELERVIHRLTGKHRPVTGSGRTDRGVHARGQVASVTVPVSWPAGRLRKGLNALLPRDIRVPEIRRVPDEFHPRHHAIARTYEYLLGSVPDASSPFQYRWCWDTSKRPPDPDLLGRAATLIPGERDFGSFAKSGQPQRGTRCRVEKAGWSDWPPCGLRFTITANRYLHHMVRYLVGTMVAIARDMRPLDDMSRLLNDPDSELVTSPPAPPQGLFLARVDYPMERWGTDPDRDPLHGVSDIR